MFSGHSDEGYAIADSIKVQFTLSRTEIDENLEYEKLYYAKDDLEVFSYYYETLYMSVRIKNQDY